MSCQRDVYIFKAISQRDDVLVAPSVEYMRTILTDLDMLMIIYTLTV